MFSKNTYFLPQVSSQPVFHHPEMFSGHYLSPINAPPFVESSTFLNQDVNGALNVDPNWVTPNTFQRKQTVKKDRHSKIFTAQGPRDRRVRLSIGIARKFFDLQEMLGFDKPSKTLDWLLTKSKAAIKELVQMKEKATNSSSPSECEVISVEAFENGYSDSKRKPSKGKEVSNLAKESRAKARARARERTREKMCIKLQLNYNNGARNTSLNYPGNRDGAISNYALTNEAEAAHDLIQESIFIKRKTTTKHPAIFGFQQNIFVSRDLSSNYTFPSANATDNWDICAILDQHKFINSTSNI